MSPVTQRRVLFVDDDERWRETVAASLGAAGFAVLTAADGSEAMRQGMDPSLSLMIVDEDLAGESGSMLSRYLRHNNPGVPTVLFTSPERDTATAAKEGNQDADEYLPRSTVEDLILNVGYFLR